MDTATETPESFTRIFDKSQEIERLEYWKFNDADGPARERAADGIKIAKRELYSMFDELTPDEIRAYGQWRSE